MGIVGEVIAALEKANVLDKTVIIVVGDHGEGHGDHGEDEHGLLAYDSTLKVPWILRLPGRLHGGRSVDEPASLVDVMPTVAQLFGYPLPRPVDGQSLVSAVTGANEQSGEVLYAETFYPRLHFGWSELVTTRDRRFKYIRAPRPELYDTATDPGEKVNVIDEHRDVADRLDKLLSRIMSRAAVPAAAGAVDADAERRLTALGYVARGVEATAGNISGDPKDKVDAYRTLMRARYALDAGNAAAGVAMLEGLITEEPDLEAAHRALREHWIASGHAATAVAAFNNALVRRPSDPALLYDLAFAYRAANEPDAALQSLGRILSADPHHIAALRLSGEIAMGMGRTDQALGYFSRASQAEPTSDELAIKVAQAQLRLGRLTEADAQLRRTIERHPDAAGAHYLAAQIAEQRGDRTAAEREYRREIELHPWDYQARFNLAIMLGRRGAFDEQISLLDAIPPLAPAFHDVHFYRAKAYLDVGNRVRVQDAVAAARLGLRLAPTSVMAPLGHYVLADAYALQGRRAEAAVEMKKGRALEERRASK